MKFHSEVKILLRLDITAHEHANLNSFIYSYITLIIEQGQAGCAPFSTFAAPFPCCLPSRRFLRSSSISLANLDFFLIFSPFR